MILPKQLKYWLIAVLLLLPVCLQAAELVSKKEFEGGNTIVLTFTAAIDKDSFKNASGYTVFEESDPDIRLQIKDVVVSKDSRGVSLIFSEPLNTAKAHVVSIQGGDGKEIASLLVKKSYLGYLLSILISALLVNNFVFTKYLGLCVFFGTSKRKATAKGMGVVFTIVMVVSAIMSWFFYQFILIPYDLNFLQIVVFIGLVSLTVQAVDTILRKVNPILFNSLM